MNASYPELDQRLAALRAEAQAWCPPVALDDAIAAAGNRPARRAPSPQQWVLWPLALAASIAVLSLTVRAMLAPPDPAYAEPAASVRPTFTPVVPIAEIQRTADAVVVPARVPRMTLAQYGLPVDPARADDPVDTELLVRRDGALLAYRFVE
jgi:hypothetical protein